MCKSLYSVIHDQAWTITHKSRAYNLIQYFSIILPKFSPNNDFKLFIFRTSRFGEIVSVYTLLKKTLTVKSINPKRWDRNVSWEVGKSNSRLWQNKQYDKSGCINHVRKATKKKISWLSMKGMKMNFSTMTRAWDKEKLWVPDGNRTHGLPDTGWALLPTELRETRGELGHLLG